MEEAKFISIEDVKSGEIFSSQDGKMYIVFKRGQLYKICRIELKEHISIEKYNIHRDEDLEEWLGCKIKTIFNNKSLARMVVKDEDRG